MEDLIIVFALGALALLVLIAIARAAGTSAPSRGTSQEEIRRIEAEARQQIQAVSDESLHQFAKGLQKHKKDR